MVNLERFFKYTLNLEYMSDSEGRNESRGGNLGRRRMLQLSGVTTFGTLFVGSAAGEEEDEVETEASHQVSVSGPSNVEVGGSYQYQAGGYEGSGNYAYFWSSSGTISGDGKTVTVTFDSEGMHTVSVTVADLDQGIPLGGDEMDVQAVSEEVDMELEGPDEIVMDRTATFTAHADPGDAAFERIEWDVLYVNDDEFDVVEENDGLTAEIEFHTEGTRTVRVEYETDQGYRDSETVRLEVVDLDWYVNKKLALSDEVTRLSASINERQRVEPTLASIEQRARDGVVAPTTARDAINRMRLAEDVTEKAFAGFGPRVATSPEENLVGEPADSLPAQSEYEHPELGFPIFGPKADVNLSGETVGSVGWLVLGAAAGYKALAKVFKRFSMIDEITRAKEMVSDTIVAAASLLPVEKAIEFRMEFERKKAAFFVEHILDEEVEDKEELLDFSIPLVTDVRNMIGDGLFEEFEESGGAPGWSGFNEHLQNVDNEMSAGGAGAIELQGTQDGAESAAARGGKRTVDSIENGMNSITSVDIVSLIGDVLALVAAVLLAGALLTGGISVAAAAIVGMIGLFLTLSAEFLSITAGMIQMYTIREIHENALDAIIAGEDWV